MTNILIKCTGIHRHPAFLSVSARSQSKPKEHDETHPHTCQEKSFRLSLTTAFFESFFCSSLLHFYFSPLCVIFSFSPSSSSSFLPRYLALLPPPPLFSLQEQQCYPCLMLLETALGKSIWSQQSFSRAQPRPFLSSLGAKQQVL